jgi:hypothetical protein
MKVGDEIFSELVVLGPMILASASGVCVRNRLFLTYFAAYFV